ncbi:hypothetical protein Acr_28g0013490 [Actinidia rufa]|uniref:Uncharacterized protein n=1 Tax=Actinidia rufa TaxID=165716 RepID=A0A7J0HD52_9ERIC|nr:hypothetical protein Acr_28g0013490 [Actinidia rufa]
MGTQARDEPQVANKTDDIGGTSPQFLPILSLSKAQVIDWRTPCYIVITLFNRINLEIELDQLTSPLRVEAQSIGGVASSRKSSKSRSMEGVPGRFFFPVRSCPLRHPGRRSSNRKARKSQAIE